MMTGPHKRKPKSMPRLLLGVLVLVLLSVGIAASYALLGSSQDLRQQASGPNCGAITSMVECRDTIGCKIRPYTIRFNCEDLGQEQCNEEPYSDYCTHTSTTRSYLCRHWESSGLNQCPESCKGATVGNSVVCPHPDRLDEVFSVTTASCTGGYHEIDKGECLPENITCECDHGNSAGSSGSATCTRENGISYKVANRPGCASNPGGTGSGTNNCATYTTSASCPRTNCDWHTCTNNSTVRNVCVTKGTNPCNNDANKEQMCGVSCHGKPTEFCRGMACINGVCYDPAVCGGTSGGGTPSTPWGARSISGRVVCSVNNQPIANVPVSAYVGTANGPGAVLKAGTTAGDGRYTLALDGQNETFTVRLGLSSVTKEHDYSFKRSGNPGITCIDNNAFELCRYLDIPKGTTRAGFDFATTAQAKQLRGEQGQGTVFNFKFNQARDALNRVIPQYVVRLDNKVDGWYNTNSDYYIRVPKQGTSGVGTCSAGVCTITSTELNAIRPFKFGTYSMGVNPISIAQVSGQPVIELCRADATVTAAVSNAPPGAPECGSGYTCRAKSAGAPTGNPFLCSTNYQGNYTEWYCCPVKGQVILNGRCATVGKLTPQ